MKFSPKWIGMPGTFRATLFAALCMVSLVARVGLGQTNDSSQLIGRIRSGDESARVSAIADLAKSNDVSSEVREALRELYLTDSNAQVRRAARVALGQIVRRTRKDAVVAAGATPFAFNSPKKEGSIVVSGIARSGSMGFGIPTFSSDDYVEPDPPTERVAKLIEQLKSDPPSSIIASGQLAALGEEALPACTALVEVMMRGQPAWHDAQLAATEALEKISPELQKPVWRIIVEESTDMARVSKSLAEISSLGPKGHAAMPVIMAYWNAPEETGYRVEAHLLITLHVIGLKDPKVTQELVRVLKKQLPVGDNTLEYALAISNQRGLPAEQVLELITPHLAASRFYQTVVGKMKELVEAKELTPESIATPLIKCLENGIFLDQTCKHLGHLGPAAKEALPLLKRLKFEHQDELVRTAAAEAMNLIDR